MSAEPQTTQSFSQRLRSALPVLDWAPRYQRQWLRLDFVAGLTLAAYAIPVSLAYASLACLENQGSIAISWAALRTRPSVPPGTWPWDQRRLSPFWWVPLWAAWPP